MFLSKFAPLMVLATLLTACGGSPSSEDSSLPEDVNALCVSACGTKGLMVQGIASAENLLFTPDLRLFVSGGTNVVEVFFTDPITTRPLLDGECNFTGLAQRGEVLYAACGGSSELYATQLNEMPQLQLIHPLSGMDLPNGMTTGPDDCLYITDGPTPSTVAIPSPKIVKVCFGEDPFMVQDQSTWLSLNLSYPNGLTRIGQRFYFTDTNPLTVSSQVASVDWLEDGSAGEVKSLYSSGSLLDDLSSYGNRLLVTDSLNGKIILMKLDGTFVDESDPGTFDSPSSVLVLGPPVFEQLDILVTEKGLLNDNTSTYGNRLSLFRRLPETTAR